MLVCGVVNQETRTPIVTSKPVVYAKWQQASWRAASETVGQSGTVEVVKVVMCDE